MRIPPVAVLSIDGATCEKHALLQAIKQRTCRRTPMCANNKRMAVGMAKDSHEFDKSGRQGAARILINNTKVWVFKIKLPPKCTKAPARPVHVV